MIVGCLLDVFDQVGPQILGAVKERSEDHQGLPALMEAVPVTSNNTFLHELTHNDELNVLGGKDEIQKSKGNPNNLG